MNSIPMKPGQKAMMLVMTPERKKRLAATANQAIDLILKGTEGPIEAFCVLHLLKKSLEESAGVTFDGAHLLSDEDLGDPV